MSLSSCVRLLATTAAIPSLVLAASLVPAIKAS